MKAISIKANIAISQNNQENQDFLVNEEVQIEDRQDYSWHWEEEKDTQDVHFWR